MIRRCFLLSPLALSPLAQSASHPVEESILSETNQRRKEASLPALRPDPVLSAIAQAHSQDMLDLGYFSHTNKRGQTAEQRVAQQHRRLVASIGENIGVTTRPYGSPRALGVGLVTGWMNSAPHRDNILANDWNRIGVGVAGRNGKWCATQIFADAQGSLHTDLPAQFRQFPPIRFIPEAGRKPATAFDIAKALQSNAAAGPWSFAETLSQLPEGTFILRVHIPEGSGFRLYPGPSFRIGS